MVYRVYVLGWPGCRCLRRGAQAEQRDRFVVFLHVDLRSDGLIAAAGCYWYRMLQGLASECRMAW
jgi:hypothetical protein